MEENTEIKSRCRRMIQDFRLMDDYFMTACFDGNIPGPGC